jgi:hypothetical protein
MIGLRSFSRVGLRNQIVIALIVSSVLLVSGVYFFYLPRLSGAIRAKSAASPNSVCDIFDANQVKKVSGKSVVFDNLGRFKSTDYNPDFSCMLKLEGFGELKIGYISARWFRDGPSSRVTENDLLNLQSHGWTIKKIDFGLDGSSYLAVSSKRESVVAYGACYSSLGRTFSVALYNLNDTSILDEKIEEVLVPLTRYLASSTAARFPAATGAAISTPS